MKEYHGEYRNAIRFPLGGIGAGSLSLDGGGRLRDWEMFNRPAKGSLNGFSHFGVKAEREGNVLDARVMNADLTDGLMGQYKPGVRFEGYGFGPSRYLLSGLPHFRDSVFAAQFPFARVSFIDETFPGSVSLCAFSPFIPGEEDDSSLPAAFFEIEVVNTTDCALEYTFELTVNNPAKAGRRNRAVQSDGFMGVELCGAESSLLCACPEGEDARVQRYWYRGAWFDNLSVFWREFTRPGQLPDREYPDGTQGKEDLATLFVTARAEPGERVARRFLIAWYVPECENYWSPPDERGKWKNHYATIFPDVAAVVARAFSRWAYLESESRLFSDALHASLLPPEMLDAVSCNLAVLKSPTCLRLTDGQFYGFEGCHTDEGSCEGSCTHVWNYQFALPFLFPRLERSMRETDYKYNLTKSGAMPFRLRLPLGSGVSAFRPCADGQLGGVIKTYREWLIAGDDEWLRGLWPGVKKSIEYAWSPENPDRWDFAETGVLTGRQHHTLDMELFGPNAWLTGFYLGALRAGAIMGERMGDLAFAKKCAQLFERGRAYTEEKLFNGAYYIQQIDLNDRDILRPYREGNAMTGGAAYDDYWNGEAGELKYQIGDGCGIDQTLAPCLCALSGLGEILDEDHVRSALRAVYQYNFKPNLRAYANFCRVFALNDEGGTVICEWPEGAVKPTVPLPYAQECMTGFEYMAAVQMALHGMETEALDIVRAVRARYDGQKRNPWNEFECGSNYARSMASYALLLACSGFRYDMRRGSMGMTPTHPGTYFWALSGAWGDFAAKDAAAKMRVLHGTLSIREWIVPDAARVSQLYLNDVSLPFSASRGALTLSPRALQKGDTLRAVYADGAQK